jgi:hypothetical protein
MCLLRRNCQFLSGPLVRPLSGDSEGDSEGDGDSRGEVSASALVGGRGSPPLVQRRVPQVRGRSAPGSVSGFPGGRFWVLQSCGEEDEEVLSGVSDGERQDSGESVSSGSPRATPSPLTLDAFISRAKELGGSLSAPGGGWPLRPAARAPASEA